MSPPQETRQWIVANNPSNLPILTGPSPTFKLITTPLPRIQQDQVLVKAIYFSNDPGYINMIRQTPSSPSLRLTDSPVTSSILNTPMPASGIYQVEQSLSQTLQPGTYVLGFFGWTEYAVVPAVSCQPLQPLTDQGLSLTHYLGALGGTGIPAYYGLSEIGRVSASDTVVISGAAGATGCMAVQIAKKVLGCKKVIGIAGSDDKCKWVVEAMGADVCINYKKSTFKDDLIRVCSSADGSPDVDVYFDNVGGEVLGLMLKRMKKFGRVLACGALTEYTGLSSSSSPSSSSSSSTATPSDPSGASKGAGGVPNWLSIVTSCLEVRGFIYFNADMPKYIDLLVKAYTEGKIVISGGVETLVEGGFEQVPRTWMGLWEGVNRGKLVTRVV